MTFTTMTGIGRGLRTVVLLVVLLGASVVGTGVSWGGPATVEASSNASCLNTKEREFLRLLNNYRVSKGLTKVKASKSLNIASWKHSRDMGVRTYFDHLTKSPLPAGQSGPEPWDRMKDAGYGYNTAKAENIAAGHATAQSVFNGWKNSAGHNKNMLNPNLKAIGIGYAQVKGSPYTYYWTTDFGGYVDAAPNC
jgi:uncharacterized protein YkwD